VAHIGRPAFDANLRAQMDTYVRTFARYGVKVLFLSVPWAQPRRAPNGSPRPEASARRHSEMNAILQSVARRNPGQAQFLNIDNVISPGNRYRATVNGHLSRLDGVHFTIYCARLLQRPVLDAALALARN
jgi:hypothetical protein